MAQEVGVAYVTLLPSGKGFGKAVEGQIDSAVSSAERKSGGFLNRLGGFAKGLGLALGGAVATLGTIAAVGGISRVLNIEDAQAKLRGLGNDTKTVEAIMNDALASVKGTAFGLDTAATVAASAVAAGIKPGQELERYLKLTADAATIAGVSMGEMGSIFNKVQTNTVAYTDDLQQLADRGIPIFQWLQDEYGVTAEELRKMVERGEVDAATFRKVIEENIGGAALESGNTTRGAFANMMAAISRFGAQLVGPFLGAAKEFFGEMIVVFDGITERLQPTFANLQGFLDGINFDGLGERILDKLNPLLDTVNGLVDATRNGTLEEWFAGLADSSPGLGVIAAIFEALEPILPVVKDFIGEIGDELSDAAPLFGDMLEELAPLIPVLGDLLVEALKLLVELLPSVVPLVAALAGAVVEMVSSPEFQGFVDWLADVVEYLSTPTADALRDWADSLRELGPVGEIIGGFLDQVAGLFEGDSVMDIKSNIETAFGEITSAITTPFVNVWNTLVGIWDGIVAFLSGVWATIVATATGAWSGLGETLGGILKIIYGLFTGNFALVQQEVSGFLSTVTGWWNSAWNSLVGVVSGIWGSIQSAISGGVSNAVSTVQTLPGRLMSALSGAASWLFSAGQDIVRGLIRGVESMISSAVSTVQNLAGSALSAAKDWLGIRSPSRVFRDEVGRMIGEGLIAGINLTRPDVTAAVQGLVPIPSAAGGGALGGGGGGVSNVTNIYPQETDPYILGRITGNQISRNLTGLGVKR